MSDRTITGFTSDKYVKNRMLDYAKDLSPAEDFDGRMAYASLLLDWVLEGEDEAIRLTRTMALEQAYIGHLSDRCPGINYGHQTDTSIGFPDFMIRVDRILEFLS
jgi:hypothetical protein